MAFNLNSKILLSVASIAAAAALVIGATFAFFSDTETSTGNTFTAGSLDLKVDSEAHYAGLVCNSQNVWELEAESTSRPDLVGDDCDGTWSQTNLGAENKFFNLSDIKPGDSGEDTISLHVVDNDAWGKFVIKDVSPSPDDDLRQALQFGVWLDQGATPGFQCGVTPKCIADPTEGDNVKQQTEPTLITQGTIDAGGETHNIWEGLAFAQTVNGSDQGGVLSDGRLVGSTTYYFGIAWELPTGTGNEVQADSLSATMEFQVVQARNNPGKVF